MKKTFLLAAVALATASAASAATQYWDINGATAGAGGPTPSGTWDGTTANWTSDAAGTSATTTYGNYNVAVFAAGSDATGAYAIAVAASQGMNGLTVNSGEIAFTGSSITTGNPYGGFVATVASGASASFANALVSANAGISEGAMTKLGGGTLNLAGNGNTAYRIKIDGGAINLTGGSMTASAGDGIWIADSGGTVGTLAITGGDMTTGGKSVTVGTRGAGTLEVSGTGILTANSIALGHSAGPGNNSSIVNLGTGGVITAGSVAAGQTGTRVFNFQGGTLRAAATGTLIATGNGLVVTVQDAGARIDTNGFDASVAPALTHGGVAAIDGGLIKTGAGVLTLAAANTYNGGTTVNAGTILAANAGALGAGAVTVNNGGVVQVGAGVTLALAAALTVNAGGTLSFAANSGSTIDLGGNAYTLNSGALLDVAAFTTAGTYTLITNDGGSSSFAGSFVNGTAGMNYGFSSGQLTVAAVPEPSTYGLLGVGALAGVAFVKRRRKR